MPAFKPNLSLIIPVMVIANLIIAIDTGWGYIEVYIASYLYSFSDSITTSKIHMLYSIIELGQIIGSQIFHLVTYRLGYREALSLALALNAIAWLICSLSTSI
jgi:MFS family permease